MMGQQCRSESLFYYFRIKDDVSENVEEAVRQRAQERTQAPAFFRHQRARRKIEAVFGDLKNRIGLRRVRLRRLKHVREQFLMAATAQTLKRLVRHITQLQSAVNGTSAIFGLGAAGEFFAK